MNESFMNNKLADIYERAMVLEDGGDYVSGELDIVKFAELIVQECAEVSKNYAVGTIPLSISHAIKEHFGVEATTAPALLKAQMPACRQIEAKLVEYGYVKGTPEWYTAFDREITSFRWAGAMK